MFAAVLTTAASLFLAFMMGITVLDIVLRAISPAWRIFGILDYVEFSLDWVIYLAIPAALFSNSLIVVDLIDEFVAARIFRLIGLFLTLVVFVVLTTEVIRPGLATLEWQDRTLDLGLLKFWYWIPIWLGFALASFATALSLVGELRNE